MSRRGDEHYLYVVASPQAPDILKIGIAKDPHRRIRDLQIGSPLKLNLLALWLYPNRSGASQAEKGCHERFEKQNKHGEWFAVTVDMVALHLDAHNTQHIAGGIRVRDVRQPVLQKSAAERLAQPMVRPPRKPPRDWLPKPKTTAPSDMAIMKEALAAYIKRGRQLAA